MPSRARTPALHLLLLALAALFVVHPLIVNGCSCGHDFDFHLQSWLDAASQLRHGQLHPHWDFSAAWNAGEPRFTFYPPLSWFLGATTGLLLSHLPAVSEPAAWNAAPIVFTWIALTLSGIAMYRFARDYARPRAALIAGIIYLANPYMLFTAYERTAYAELLAAAWMPLLLHGLLRPRISIPRIAIPLTLLWLTNAPAAVIGSYTLALIAIVRLINAFALEKTPQESRLVALVRSRRVPAAMLRLAGPVNLALPLIAGAALGLLTAAFYIVPAAYEQRSVQIHMVEISGMQIASNFLFRHTVGPDAALHDQVLHTASVIAVLLWLASAALLATNYILCRKVRTATLPSAGVRMLPTTILAVVTAVIGFVLTPWSEPLWQHAPEAAFLQFPWRAVSVLAVIAALALAGVLTRNAERPRLETGLTIIALIALVIPCYHLFRQGCDPEDTPNARLAAFVTSQGSEPTDEYTPTEADNDSMAQTNPPYWIAAQPTAAAPAGEKPGMAPLHHAFQLPRAADLILNLRDYPAWTVLLDGAPDLQRLPRADGLIAIPLPAGSSTVDIRWTRLPDEKLGDLLTLLGLGLLIASLLPLRWRMRHAIEAEQSSSADR